MPGLHTNRGRKRARRRGLTSASTRSAPLDCVLTVVEQDRAVLPVGITDGFPNEVAGACFREGGRTMLWVNGTDAPRASGSRSRTSSAMSSVTTTARLRGRHFATMSGRETNPREIEANAFAAEFLFPTAAGAGGAGTPTLEDVIRIAAFPASARPSSSTGPRGAGPRDGRGSSSSRARSRRGCPSSWRPISGWPPRWSACADRRAPAVPLPGAGGDAARRGARRARGGRRRGRRRDRRRL